MSEKKKTNWLMPLIIGVVILVFLYFYFMIPVLDYSENIEDNTLHDKNEIINDDDEINIDDI